MAEQKTGVINGIDTDAVRAGVGLIAADAPEVATMKYDVTTEWQGQTKMVSKVGTFEFRGEKLDRKHTITMDEPPHLGGKDEHLNPQEALFAALNSCLMVAFVFGAAMNGVTLEKLEIRTRGTLDLRGVFAIDPASPPGYKTIQLDVRVKGNGTKEQFQAILDGARAVSPNFYNVSQPIQLDAKLVWD